MAASAPAPSFIVPTPFVFAHATQTRRAINRSMVEGTHAPGQTPEECAHAAILELRTVLPGAVVAALSPDDGRGRDPQRARARLARDPRNFRRAAPKRERLLDLVVAGAQRKEMAHVLECSQNTVRNSLVTAYRWLDEEVGAQITTRGGAALAWRDRCRASGHRPSEIDIARLAAYRRERARARITSAAVDQTADDADTAAA